MKTLKTLALATAVSAGLLGSAGAIAANNPPSATPLKSSGDFEILFDNGTQLKLYGLKDVDITQSDATADPSGLNGSTPVCVAANVAKYNISMKTDNGDSIFKLTSSESVNNR